MKFKELIDELEEVIEDASKIPLSNKCMIDKEEVFNIIQQIRLTYPEDIKQAEYVRKERDRILQDAEKESNIITENAKAKVAKLVNDSEIIKIAKEKATEILQDATKNAQQILNDSEEQVRKIQEQKSQELMQEQESALGYIDGMLGQAESTAESSVTAMVKLIDEMNQHYDQLRSVYEKISKNRQVYREKNNLQ